MTGDEFDTMMCTAAKQRRVVELVDGRVGTLVYWPGRRALQRSRVKPLRHGDPLAAGVRLDPAQPDRVAAVACSDVVGFVGDVS